MSKLDCLRQAAVEHEEMYWKEEEADEKLLIAGRRLAVAMKDAGHQQIHFRGLTILAGRFDLGPRIDMVTVAETIEED